MRRLLYRLSQLWAWFLFIFFYGVRAYGRRNIPAGGPFIVACTHQSYLDPVVVGFTCPAPVRYFARRSLFRNPLFAALIRAYGAFAVERETADLGALRKALRFLRGGEAVLLFPEGTRTRDGRIGEVKPGVFLLAERAGVPVVPAVIEGAREIWPRKRKMPRFFLPLRILYGKPFRVERGSDVRALCRKLRREYVRGQVRLLGTMGRRPLEEV